MQSFTEKILSFQNQFGSNTATPDLKSIVKDIASSLFILMISLSLIVTLLVPTILDMIAGTIFLQSVFDWALALANVLLLGFLLAVSLIVLAQSLVDYRNTRDLNRFGVVIKGLLVDKWIDVSDEKLVYWVRYKYLTQFQAVQTVDKDIFRQLKRDENVRVLHLERFPYISRLDLDQ